MSIFGEIHATLDAMGVEQQVCVFVFLVSYPLTLGAMLEARGRKFAAGVAAGSALAFAVFTDPWFHAVLLVVGGVGAVGMFIALVYTADHIHRRFYLRPATSHLAVDNPAAEEPAAGATAMVPSPAIERIPLSPAAPAKT